MTEAAIVVPTILPVVTFRRIRCDHLGRTLAGPRLKDFYVAPLSEGRFVVTNFSGAFQILDGPCPFPEATRPKVDPEASGDDS